MVHPRETDIGQEVTSSGRTGGCLSVYFVFAGSPSFKLKDLIKTKLLFSPIILGF